MRLAVAIFFALSLPLSAFAASDINVLSWNVYMLPWPIKKSQQSERSVAIAATLAKSKYDIMFFQEAFSVGFRKRMMKEVAKEYPYARYLGSDGKIKHVFGSGLLIMSKRPFKELDHVYFKECAGADCYAAKGSILIETTLANGRTVQFATTHLQSMDAQGSKRMADLQLIKKMLAAHQRHGIPQILMGDLNIDVKQPEFLKGLELLDFKNGDLIGDVPYTSGLTGACYNTDHDGHSTIDHAWASTDGTVGAIATRVRVMTYVNKGRTCPSSDHHAIEVRANLN